MSVEGFGKQILSEIEEEGLDNLLKLLRNAIDPYTAHELKIPALDRIYRVFLNLRRQQPDFSGQQQSRELTQSVTSKPSRAPVIEISEASPCSGKTQLLYLAVASTLLPADFEAESPSRNGGAVIWLDSDGRFSILRLRQVILQLINQRHERTDRTSSPMQVEAAQNLCKSSLQHLHIFQPQSSDSLISTINSLPSYLFNPSLHHSSSRPLRLLALSNLSAFLGSDRLDTADNDSTVPSAQFHNSHFTQRYTNLVASLRDIQETFDCTVIATNWSLSPVQKTANGLSARPHLPNVWNNFCTLKLLVKRNGKSKFGAGISAEEAAVIVQEAAKGGKADKQTSFSCHVNYWGCEDWPNGVLKGLQDLRNGGSFSFAVDGNGVRVED